MRSAGSASSGLKCGDPFVLGRGGEEAITLANAGVPFEVVPGITTAVAAPDLAGIPLTHRGVASGFLVVSGHSENVFGPILDHVSPQSLTLVVLMGLASRSQVAHRLFRRGWSPRTPAAVVLAAATPNMRTWAGCLEDLGAAELDNRENAPGTIIIGDTVGLRRAEPNPRWADQVVDAIASGRQT